MHGEAGDPLSQEDCETAYNLCISMSQVFPNEESREQAFVDLLERYLGLVIRKWGPNTKVSRAITDGTILYVLDDGGRLFKVPVFILEVKNEVGGVRSLRWVGSPSPHPAPHFKCPSSSHLLLT